MVSHPSPEDVLSNAVLQNLLQQDIARIADEAEVPLDGSFLRVCIDYLGFDRDLGVISDGAGDHGVDYIEVSDSGASIIQAKSFEFDRNIDFDRRIGPGHITDLPRIRSLFEHLDNPPTQLNTIAKRHLLDIKQNLRSRGAKDVADPLHVTVYFCAQAADFTTAAKHEFDTLNSDPITYGDATIVIAYLPVFLADLLDAKWRQSNTKWRDKQNRKREQFDFDLCGTPIRDSSKSCVFFTRASQLVDAYNDIGYQLFEPNVRCEIKNSSVNKAIKASVRTHRGREEFKHLNNGITVVCDSFRYMGGQQNPTRVRITRPGVINGLQTIKTLADAVAEHMSHQEYVHFRDKCQILTRVHAQNAVNNYRDLVKSTNNQNPMKPRNLRSNDFEQVLLERYFSDSLNWFYERKEGAWNAFKADPGRWSTINRRPTHFTNKRIVRRVDNEAIAQAWLAFIGYSPQAVDQKRYLFAEDRSFYDLIFRHRTAHHGRHYGHRIAESRVMDDSEVTSPTGEGMLVAYLIREFAKNVVKTRKENWDDAVARRNIGNLDRASQGAELAQDREYLKGLSLRSMLLLFVEFVGYVMFATFGEEVHAKCGRLLRNGTMCRMFEDGDFTAAKARRDEKYVSDDVLLHLWELYNHCVSQMVATGWLRERQQAPNISKFTYSEKTREPLYAELREAEKVFEDGALVRKWTVPFNKHGGVERYLAAVLG